MDKTCITYADSMSEVLKEDLKVQVDRLKIIYDELVEYVQLKNILENVGDVKAKDRNIKTKIDIGCEFYMQANVTDTDNVLISIGPDYFIEFKIAEAILFVRKRIRLLEDYSAQIEKHSASIKAHLKLLLVDCYQKFPVK